MTGTWGFASDCSGSCSPTRSRSKPSSDSWFFDDWTAIPSEHDVVDPLPRAADPDRGRDRVRTDARDRRRRLAQAPAGVPGDASRAALASAGSRGARGGGRGEARGGGRAGSAAPGGAPGGRPAAIVLLSDGRDSGSSISPDLAAARAAQLGVPVFTVAIGNVPTGDTSVNVLGQIAQQTGAKTYTTRSAHELSQVYDTLGSRLSYELAIGNRAGSFLLVAVLLILAAAAVALMGTRDPFDASNRRRVGGSPRSRPSDPTARRRQLPTR